MGNLPVSLIQGYGCSLHTPELLLQIEEKGDNPALLKGHVPLYKTVNKNSYITVLSALSDELIKKTP